MKKKLYLSYSTDYKTAVLSGRKLPCSYSNKHYWNNEGRKRIVDAIFEENNHLPEGSALQMKEQLNELFEEFFGLLHTLIDSGNKTMRLYKKSKLKIVKVWEMLKPFSSSESLSKWFRISESTYYYWKKRTSCRVTHTKECPNSSPHQLRDWEVRLLDEYFKNPLYEDYSISELHGQIMAEGKLIIGSSILYEYASLLGECEKRKIPKRKKEYSSLTSEKPKSILQMDKTKVKVNNIPHVWIYLVIDNYSRAILHPIVSRNSHSKYTRQNLESAMKKHKLIDASFMLVCDDGSENKGEVKKFISHHPNIDYRIAQKTIEQSNSMVEAVIKQLKYRYLKQFSFSSLSELKAALEKAVRLYNSRPRRIHLGKSPQQVLSGDEVDRYEYELLKKKTKRERYDENKGFACLKAQYELMG